MSQTVLYQDCSTFVHRLTKKNQIIVTLSLTARSSDLVQIEHVGDILGRNERCYHDVRTHPQMINDLSREWAVNPQNHIRIIIGLKHCQCTACMLADIGHTSN